MKCGACTLCCKLLEIKEMESKAGTWCKSCDPKKGCTIYTTRPWECSEFKCMYRQMPKCSEDIRPDKIKVIFEKISNRLIFGTLDKHLKNPSSVFRKQVDDFGKQGYSVVLKRAGTTDKFLIRNPKHTTEDLRQDFEDFLKARANGSSIIHN